MNKNISKYKDDDITKMHAYKDAIKLAKGAYILYPGKENKIFNETEGVFRIESGKLNMVYNTNIANKNAVGALCLNPNNYQNLCDIKNLILKLIKKEC